jgi:hypothetical protein
MIKEIDLNTKAVGHSLKANVQLYRRLRKVMFARDRCSNQPHLIADIDLAEQYFRKNNKGWLGLVIYLVSQSTSAEEFDRRMVNCVAPLFTEFRIYFPIINWLHSYSYASAKWLAACSADLILLLERTFLAGVQAAVMTAKDEALLAELERHEHIFYVGAEALALPN